jgi:LysM repeat protein
VRDVIASRRRTSRTSAAVAAAVSLAVGSLSGCGSSPLESLTTDTEPAVEVTEYVTLPPPTTTIPPTTTQPPEPGSVLASEATYVVVVGDFPFVVANRFGVDFKEFVELNGWTIVDGIVPEWPAPGTTIRIPAGATVPGGPSVLVPVPTTTIPGGVPVVPGSEVPGSEVPVDGTASGTSTTVDDGIGCGTYEIRAGDYPSLVASALGTTVDELAEANEDTDGYAAFYVGLVINVPC